MFPIMIDRLSPAERPPGRPAGFQRWRSLLFLHWEVPAAALARLLPSELTVDTYEGKAWVGVVPFTMRDVAPRWSPSVPGISHFHELNVRTYVHRRGEDPGVWFFSLDAAATIAVAVARAGWHLPYHRASMKLDITGDTVEYRSKRLFPGPTPAEFEARYHVGASIGPAKPGTLTHFFAERYILYARTRAGLSIGRVHHVPYPLHEVQVESWRDGMVASAGLPPPTSEPLALYSPGVDVDVYNLVPVG
ncbi:DUF2071 domain-containing protein [Polyangium spumosum]|uniref:DUF2071 domain-containing protein n=2 Tax=Polyangium spumosum TaxID=889282 RepID=A0A6N7PQS6_9BACT|nr:DUF2071 domain-containing protein [Polyangium spumosum]